MKKRVFCLAILLSAIISSCASVNTEGLCFSEQSVVLEATKEGIDLSLIRPICKFGKSRNCFTNESYFRDYVAYPYYSIRKFCSALDGEITEMCKWKDNGEGASITVRTGKLEIEYFGSFWFAENLSVGGKIKKGTYLGRMYGGGDGGMVLHLRTRYNGKVVDPELFFYDSISLER